MSELFHTEDVIRNLENDTVIQCVPPSGAPYLQSGRFVIFRREDIDGFMDTIQTMARTKNNYYKKYGEKDHGKEKEA